MHAMKFIELVRMAFFVVKAFVCSIEKMCELFTFVKDETENNCSLEQKKRKIENNNNVPFRSFAWNS